MESMLIVRLAVNAVALWAAVNIVPSLQGSVLNNDWTTYALLGLIFGVVNTFLRPVLQIMSCPLYILTLGLFSLVVNTVLFAVTFWIGSQFNMTTTIEWIPAFLGALVVSIVSMILYAVIPDGKPRSGAKRPF